jgi:hypothetical protein
MSAKGKKKSLGAVTSVVNDELSNRIRDALLGTVIIDVRLLNAEWPNGRNRELNTGHLENLRESMASGVRRYDVDTRMKADMTQKDWDQLLNHLVAQYSAANTTPIPQNKGNPVKKWTPHILQEIVQNSTANPSPSKDVVVFDWPKDLPHMTLDAGQHRKAALESLLLDQQVAAARPPPATTDDDGTPPPTIKMPTDEVSEI